MKQAKQRVAVLCEETLLEEFQSLGVCVLNLGKTEEEMAARLYGLLREAEKKAELLIAVSPKKQDGIMVGVHNRLKKACASIDIKH